MESSLGSFVLFRWCVFFFGPIVFFFSSLLLHSFLIVYGWFRKLFMERIYKLRTEWVCIVCTHLKTKKNMENCTKKWEVILNLHSQNKIAEQKNNNNNKMLWKKFVGYFICMVCWLCSALCESVWVCYDICWFICFL